MKHLIGIECNSLDELQERIEKDFLGNVEYDSIEEGFKCRLGKKYFWLNICHVYPEPEFNIEESFYIEEISEGIDEKID